MEPPAPEYPPRTEAADIEILLFGQRLIGRIEEIVGAETTALDGPEAMQLTARVGFPYRMTKTPYRSNTLRPAFVTYDKTELFPPGNNFKQYGYSFESVEKTGNMKIEPYFHVVMFDNGQYEMKFPLNDDRAMLVFSFDKSIANLDELLKRFDNPFIHEVLFRVGLADRLPLNGSLLEDQPDNSPPDAETA